MGCSTENTMSSNQGPTILWEQLRGKKVKASDGQELGEIKEISQNYLLVEKGLVSKDKVWVPKYVADAYDGKTLWLLVSSDEAAKGYSFEEQPAREQYAREFETFRATPHGQNAVYLPDLDQNIRLTEERPASSTATGENYKNIREPD